MAFQANPVKISFLVTLIFLCICFAPEAAPGAERAFSPNLAAPDSIAYFVATNGNDAWSGGLAAPNSRHTDGPFASFQKARDAVRKDAAKGLHASVFIRAGIYRFDSTLRLDKRDSGRPGRPNVWRAFPNEKVCFSGGTSVGALRPIRDPNIRERLSATARESVLVAELRPQGITDFGDPPNRMNLFFKGARMPVARFPNSGWLTIAAVPQIEGHILNQGDKKVLKEGLPAGRHSGRFQYSGDRPAQWGTSNDIWMHGYWVWDWRDAYQKVERIDTVARMIYPQPPHHNYGYQKGQRYYFLNVLEELDTPGEWVLDSAAGLLYFWPPSSPNPGDVMLSTTREPILLLDGATSVQIQGITFECSRAAAVRIIGGADNLIAGCTVRNIDNDTSIIIEGGQRNGVRSCDIYDVGSTGIRIVGGDRSTLARAGNFAINNHIYRYGEILQAFNGGIFLSGVGNIVSNNRIHDAPFSGIQYYGNDHLIEFNELFDLAHESGDVGGINTGADYSEMGTAIRYNYIHDTHGRGEGGFRGIYLDLPGSNTTIVGNILANLDIGIFFNSGRDNLVENNVFVDCHPAVNIYVWPHKSYFHPGGAWKIYEKLQLIRYQEPPYSVRYPMLPHYLDSTDLGMPYGHRVVHNISTGGTWLDLSEGMDFTHVSVQNNVVGDSILLVYTRKWTPDYDPYHIGYASTHTRQDSAMIAALTELQNIVADPLFVNPSKRDFSLSVGSPAWKVGFKPIPVEKIGLQVDEFRPSLPQTRE